MIKKISILGCGWLGLPLAECLISKGFDVCGSVTRREKLNLLSEKGIDSFLIAFEPEYRGGDIKKFLEADLLIVNIPPGIKTRGEDFHLQQMKQLHVFLRQSPVKYVMYISSTSVYSDLNRAVKEDDVSVVDQSDNKTLFSAEEIFRKDKSLHTLIIRCAGLAGYDRNLVKHFAGKENLKMGNAPVNLIHRDDVIGILNAFIKADNWNNTYNISAPGHPLRKDLYPALAFRYGYAIPRYDLSDTSPFKTVSTDKLQKDLLYKFKFPDPLFFHYE